MIKSLRESKAKLRGKVKARLSVEQILPEDRADRF
jgi:hypothetical protein